MKCAECGTLLAPGNPQCPLIWRHRSEMAGVDLIAMRSEGGMRQEMNPAIARGRCPNCREHGGCYRSACSRGGGGQPCSCHIETRAQLAGMDPGKVAQMAAERRLIRAPLSKINFNFQAPHAH